MLWRCTCTCTSNQLLVLIQKKLPHKSIIMCVYNIVYMYNYMYMYMGYHSNGLSSSITYSFQATNNMERSVWIEKIQESILNALNLAPEKKEGKKGVRAAVSQHVLLLQTVCMLQIFEPMSEN